MARAWASARTKLAFLIVIQRLPPGAQLIEQNDLNDTFTLVANDIASSSVDKNSYKLFHGEHLVQITRNLGFALEQLTRDLDPVVALEASPCLFVHAGVVGWQGGAIVIPGHSMTGKTSLVAALVKAGATYYSDEYAVYDPEGYVHLYPKPLHIRIGQQGHCKKISSRRDKPCCDSSIIPLTPCDVRSVRSTFLPK